MMKPISTALDALVYDNSHKPDDPDYLRNHPGNSSEALNSYPARLRKHHKLQDLTDDEFKVLLERVRAEYRDKEKLCESPLERTMLAALMMGNWHFLENPFVPVFDPNTKGRLPDLPVIIIPQFRVLRYRLDFAVAVKAENKAFLWAIECDGKDFHDADADRERDANLKAIGIRTVRVTGSDIAANPMAAADAIISQLWFWMTQV